MGVPGTVEEKEVGLPELDGADEEGILHKYLLLLLSHYLCHSQEILYEDISIGFSNWDAFFNMVHFVSFLPFPASECTIHSIGGCAVLNSRTTINE